MRKIKIIEQLSLDGVIQAPGGRDEDGDYAHGGWAMPYFALESKARIAWATRTLSYWTGLVHVAVGHVASDEVQDLSRTNHSSQPPPATPP